MEINIEHILLFKTTISTEADKRFIAKVMEARQIEQWTVDLQDVDCVLRIVSSTLQRTEVIEFISENGYLCEVLT